MPTYAETLKNKQQELIRKALDGSALIGSSDVVALTATELFDADGELKALPTAGSAKMPWGDLGWLTTDGVQFSRDVSNTEVTSWGSVTPTRTDVQSDTSTVQVTCQETNLRTIALSSGFDANQLVPAAATGGAVELKKPVRPVSKTYRLLTIAVDETPAGELYIGRFFPRAKIESFGEQAFGGGDDPITWAATFKGEVDDALGYSESWFFGGPGWASLLTKMGLPAPV